MKKCGFFSGCSRERCLFSDSIHLASRCESIHHAHDENWSLSSLFFCLFAGKRASIESMSPNLTVKEGKRVRIVCKVDGEPAPKVTWFKDGKSINRNRTKYIFVHLRWVTTRAFPRIVADASDDFSRRRSDLIIKSAVWKDSGQYECRAKNKLTSKRPVSNFTWLDVLSKHNPTTERTSKQTEFIIDWSVNRRDFS